MFGFKQVLRRKIKPGTKQPVVLLILDGWGVAPYSSGNAIQQAKTPNIVKLTASYPHGQLIASGESVGLPANEVGNTEVGHLTIGAGRVILQDLKRINNAIRDTSFFSNRAFEMALSHKTKFNSNLHIIGLCSNGNVHASLEHLYALITLCKLKEKKDVLFHLFTDGRDTAPQEAASIFEEVEQQLSTSGVGRIASISGRYFAMDRDGRWERTEKVYRAIVEGNGPKAKNALDIIAAYYEKNVTDEFIEPTLILDRNGSTSPIGDNDAVIFFNFRIDRPRQLSLALMLPEFESLKSFDPGYSADSEKVSQMVNFRGTFLRNKRLQNLCFVTMTEYQKNLPVNAIAFPPQTTTNTLGEIVAQNGFKQLRLAESEKERFVTYYFNGGREERFVGEDVVIVPSPKVSTYDKKPEMSVQKLVSEFEYALRKDTYSLFVINIANPDMVAHTGNIKATIRALEATDQAIGKIVEFTIEAGGSILISVDHGNAEELVTYPSQSFFFTTEKGSRNTDHSNNPVPVIIIHKSFLGNSKDLGQGALSDIAPTILGMMNIEKPIVMTGNNMLSR